jgi:hypothetical protein
LRWVVGWTVSANMKLRSAPVTVYVPGEQNRDEPNEDGLLKCSWTALAICADKLQAMPVLETLNP